MKPRDSFFLLLLLVAAFFFFKEKNVELGISTVRAERQPSVQVQEVHSLIKPSTAAVVTATGVASPPVTNTAATSEEERARRKALCALKNLQMSIPTQGEIKAMVFPLIEVAKERPTKFSAWIKSSECPLDKYSVVHFTAEGEVLKELDCRQTPMTELAQFSGQQSEVIDVQPKSSELNFALSGGGYFTMQCSDGSFLLTRDGRLKNDDSDQVINDQGCVLLNSHGTAFEGNKITSEGCSETGDCIAIVNPAVDTITGLDYINSFSFRADFVAVEDSVFSLNSAVGRPSFLQNALEKVDDPERGPTGIVWENQPFVNLEKLQCP